MRISAIQSERLSSPKMVSCKNILYSTKPAKEISQDSFCKNNDVSFKGIGKAFKYGSWSIIGLGLITLLTGGMAAVVTLPLMIWILVGGAGVAAGAVTKDEDDDFPDGNTLTGP